MTLWDSHFVFYQILSWISLWNAMNELALKIQDLLRLGTILIATMFGSKKGGRLFVIFWFLKTLSLSVIYGSFEPSNCALSNMPSSIPNGDVHMNQKPSVWAVFFGNYFWVRRDQYITTGATACKAALAALALRKALQSWFLPSFAQSAKPLQSINWLFD